VRSGGTPIKWSFDLALPNYAAFLVNGSVTAFLTTFYTTRLFPISFTGYSPNFSYFSYT
jgi:hypothetical protein